MTPLWLEETVEECGFTAPSRFPRNLSADIPTRLSVKVVALPHLTPQAVRDWLLRRGIRQPVEGDASDFHGCMVARAGHGFLFVDTSEGNAEQRFTIAHELSHFILDQWLPRQRALRVFGDQILPVLDGLREPTPDEAMTALFEKLSLGPPVNLMARDASGHYARRAVMDSEWRADLLALELLAPAKLVVPLVMDIPAEEATGLLFFRYGLPREMANTYVQELRRRQRTPRFSIEKFLGVEGG